MSFHIISVTGAHSKVGKTTLCSILLKHLKGYGAIKFTKSDLYTSVTNDMDVILQGDKDTAVMSRAGAEKVVWIKSSRSELEEALNIAMSKMNGLKGVVVEGNSPVNYLNPDLLIFIIGGDGRIKPSAKAVCEMADIVVINSGHEMSAPGVNASSDKKFKTFRIDLIRKEGEIDKLLSYAKKYIKE